jgi:hypothetical protein
MLMVIKASVVPIAILASASMLDVIILTVILASVVMLWPVL